jgi:hypothetical protein
MSIDDANRIRSLDLDPERGGNRSGVDVNVAERSLDREAGGREQREQDQREQDQEDRQADGPVAPSANRDIGTERRLGVPDRRQDRQFADPSASERGRARQVDGPTERNPS